MVVFLLLFLIAILVFGPGVVKAWAGGALVSALVFVLVTADGVAASVFGNVWFWVIIVGGTGMAAVLRLSGASWHEVMTGRKGPKNR